MRAAKRNGTIDFLRFIFCMVIVIHHGRNLGGTPEIALFVDAGYIGVEFFFLVSGFLMAKSAAGRQEQDCTRLGAETVQFLWRKIKPLLAAYVFAVICSFGRMVIAEAYTFGEAVRKLLLGVWDLMFLRTSGIKTVGLVRGTWYLSAMFLSMLVLYPMLRKWKETFTHILAPLIAVFLLGYLSQTYGNLNQYVADYGIVYSGILRALAELSLGCVCFAVCEKIRKVHFTFLSRLLVTLVQLAGYAGVIYCAGDLPAAQFDFVMLLCLAVCITLSFSGQGLETAMFRSSFFTWLGKLSMVVYLNHMWVKDSVAALLPGGFGYWKLMGIYLACVFAVSLICLLWEKGLHLFWNRFGTGIRGWFVKKEDLRK